MAYVIAEPCLGVKDATCVDACPVDCIHPKRGSTDYEQSKMLYIDPVECIDCGACVPVCPVSAIFALDDLPQKWSQYAEFNSAYFGRGGSLPNRVNGTLSVAPPTENVRDHNVFPTGVPSELGSKPCIFISHRTADKKLAAAIAQFFDVAGIFYWFDKRDLTIQEWLAKGASEDEALVHSIDLGIRHCTDLLGIITPKVMGSWWVPYEIGSARARDLSTAHLVLKTVRYVPEYIRVSRLLWTDAELFEWSNAYRTSAETLQNTQAAFRPVQALIRRRQRRG